MNTDCRYGFGKTVDSGFSETMTRLTDLLNRNGFEIHSRIDMRTVFPENQPLPFDNYVILGVCRSDFAKRAFNADRNIGLLLPCKIIVIDQAPDEVTVMFMDPIHIMDLVNKPAAIEVAIEVKEIFEALVEQL